jgi:hypothetical protein
LDTISIEEPPTRMVDPPARPATALEGGEFQ